MDFQKVHGWPRPVRIRLQGSEPGTVRQSFLDIKTPHRTKRCGKLVDLEGFEPLTSRMRTERSPMRTLKKPPKNRTFLCETAKKYRRNAGFQTSITFEKKLPFLLQCEKVTLQEGCASDAIWTGDHLNTSCGSRTVWGWFGLYPLYNKIDEKQLDFSGCFFFIAQIGKNSADGYAPSEDENAQKKLSNIALLYTKYSNRYTHHKTYTV